MKHQDWRIVSTLFVVGFLVCILLVIPIMLTPPVGAIPVAFTPTAWLYLPHVNRQPTPMPTFTPGPHPPQLLFQKYSDPYSDIYLVNADGSGLRKLLSISSGDIELGCAAWSPDGSRIAYYIFQELSEQGTGLYLMNPDGSGQHLLLSTPGINGSSWSPNGSSIVYSILTSSQLDFMHDIMVIDVDSRLAISLTNTVDYTELEPNWSPNGTKIAYRCGSDFHARDICTMNADGTNPQNLTNTPDYSEVDPVWSPDGNKLAFNSKRDGDYDIYIMNSDGSNVINITNNSVRDVAGRWSPDGQWIAFVTEGAYGWDIVKVRPDGTGLTSITTTETWHEYGVYWSPDGTMLAVTACQAYPCYTGDIFIMNSDGSNARRLSSTTADYECLSWRP